MTREEEDEGKKEKPMQKVDTFEDVIIGVSINGSVFLIEAPDEMKEIFDGAMIEDNVQSLDKYPVEPGVYRCIVEYWFERGTYDGWDAPGESEWDFVPVVIRRISTESPRDVEMANEIADKWRDKAIALERAAKAGCDLSTWAAAIDWHGGSNTEEWLSELREKIEICQDLSKEAGLKIIGVLGGG